MVLSKGKKWAKAMNNLKKEDLFQEAIAFTKEFTSTDIPALHGVTDGKAIGTFVEHRFKEYLEKKYKFEMGNSASGIDLPDPSVNTDIKVTYIKQPQSSCPYKSSDQKIFGLGYNLLVFVYDRNETIGQCPLTFLNVTYMTQENTADFTMTKRLREMITDGANKEDIVAYFQDRMLPGNDDVLNDLADKVLAKGVTQGYLTISNALQWRLQYSRVIALKNSVTGVENYDNDKD
jgi:hypothetical protein